MENAPTFQMLLERMPARIAHYRIVHSMQAAREKPLALIVEDQLFSRTILHEMLRHDYRVDMAASAQEGLYLFLENAPDLVFLDIELMDESGHSLARALRAIDPKVFITMVTANHSPEDIAQAKANGVDGFIAKPYSKQKIGESLAAFKASHDTPTTQGRSS